MRRSDFHRQVLILILTVTASIGMAKDEPVAELPLQRGFYVAADTACADASNATITLVTRTGINVAQAECVIKSIDRTGPTSFAVTDRCTELSSDTDFGETTTLYDIPDSRTYRYTVDGFDGASRYCEQTDLPDPWAHNDISDVLR